MKITNWLLICINCLLLMASHLCNAQSTNHFPYQNSKLSINIRAKDLLSRMTIEEKVAQLLAINNEAYKKDFLTDSVMAIKLGNGIGSIQPDFTKIVPTIEMRNTVQKYLKEKSRLGIPAIFVDEGCHGVLKPEATSFPMPIALSCSWDTSLVKKVFSVTANEMRSRGAQFSLTPVIDISRDQRWGRLSETFGEDPYLSGLLGVSSVIGLQGTNTGIVAENHVAATLKHFAGHGQSENGINQGPASFPERTMRELHLLPFQMTIKKAKPVAIMTAYVENDGIPCSMNTWLLKKVLRGEWGFNGIIVSDYYSIEQLWHATFMHGHFVAKDAKDAACLAFNAGVNWDLPDGSSFSFIPELIKDGKINQSDVDSAVFRTLKLKFQLGLFENPYVDAIKAVEISKLQTSSDLALESAHKSMVLLKNDGNLLPLPKGKYKKIAVIGSCAKDIFLGGYSGDPYHRVSILDGIKNKTGKEADVFFAQGCYITTNFDSTSSYKNIITNDIKFPSYEENMKLIAKAVETAKRAEIIILAIGEHEQISREAFQSSLGDAATLNLLSNQDELTRALVATGKPVIVYLMNGRPLAINYQTQNVPAIIEGWYLGQETGTAVADVIFGDVNPSGKLTVTVPKSVGQLPMYYNYKPTAHIDYVSLDSKPLFPFGFGLSYTTYTYNNLKLTKDSMDVNEAVIASIDVKNTGKMKGDEIVQLYIRDKISSVTRPVKELKGFERISLEAGQTKTVQFTIDKSMLSFWDINMNFTTEPGDFDIMIGSSSVDLQTVKLTVTQN